MLALRTACTRPPYYQRHVRIQQRKFMQGLCDGFLDLALALPLPPSLPPYATTIILTTVVTRVALLPIAIWGRRRIRKIEEVVVPQVEKMKPDVAKQVFQDMQKERIRGDRETLKEILMKRTVAQLTKHRKELFAKHRCSPLPSIILPPLTQLPVFVITTIALGRLSVDPTPFDSESFAMLSTLANPDPTMTLPIILGILTMANVESSTWFMTAAERERVQKIQETNEKKHAELGKGARIIRPQKIIKTTLRFLSVARIIVAAVTPGSIQLYWVSSAAFGLAQTWIMDWLDARRKRRLESAESLSPMVKPEKPLKQHR